jgi:uncharacterized OB-fold protein
MTVLPDAGDVFAGPGPVAHPETQQFWESLRHGTLCLQQCEQCDSIRFPLAPVCWSCLSFRYRWVPTDRNGTVHAAIRVERTTSSSAWRDAVPFLTGLVNMNLGQRLPGRIFCDCGIAARHGTPVTMCTVPTVDGQVAWGFTHACRPAGALP